MSYFNQSHNVKADRVLTEDEIRRFAPSVFALQAHESRSERFAPIPTIDVLRGLRCEGFEVVSAKQSTARDESRREFTKHMLRLRRMTGEALRVGENIFEIILKNANDGTSAYDLMGGLFRTVCLNGMVVANETMGSVKVRHSGRAIDNVIEGTYRVVDDAQLALAAPEQWSKVKLEREEQKILAEAAHVVRFGEESNLGEAIQPERLLAARREADRGNDLWLVHNRLQESIIRGGISGQARDANNRLRRSTMREVKSVDGDIRINRAMWLLSQRMAELHGVKPVQAA